MADISFDTTGLFSENPNASGQAGTAVLPDSTIMNDYWKYAESQYNNKLFNYQKQKDDEQRVVNALDFDTAGIFERDVPELDRQINDVTKFVYEHPDSVVWGSPYFQKYREMASSVDLNINKSKADKATYDYWNKLYSSDKNYVNHAADYLNPLNQWGDIKLSERGAYDAPPPKIDYNVFEVFGDMPKGETETTGNVQSIGGGMISIPSTKSFTEQDIDEATRTAYNTDYKGTKRHFDEIFMSLPDAEKMRYQTPLNYAISQFRALNTESKSQKTQGINYAPTSGGGNKTDNATRWIAELAYKLNDPNSDVWSGNVVDKNGKVIGKGSTAFNRLKVNTGKKDINGNTIYSNIGEMRMIDGKLYAIPVYSQSSTGYSSQKDAVLITDPKTQLIAPYINQEYGTSPNTSELVQTTFDIYDSMKGGGQTQQQKTYSSQQEEGIKAVMAKNPNATREEVIKALQDAGKLPK